MNRVDKLRKKRDDLWSRFRKLPKKGSFSGLHLSGELESVQQKLDRLEVGRFKRTARYYPEITIEIG